MTTTDPQPLFRATTFTSSDQLQPAEQWLRNLEQLAAARRAKTDAQLLHVLATGNPEVRAAWDASSNALDLIDQQLVNTRAELAAARQKFEVAT